MARPFGKASGLPWPAVWLAIRSLAWAVLLPGMLAGYLPWRFFGLRDVHLNLPSLRSGQAVLGLLCIGVGVVLLGTCIWEFARSGRGTLAPVDPPRQLVVRGLYRYWALWFVGANLFVIGYEEPTLRRRFGVGYDRYQAEVGRWLPRFRSGPS